MPFIGVAETIDAGSIKLRTASVYVGIWESVTVLYILGYVLHCTAP